MDFIEKLLVNIIIIIIAVDRLTTYAPFIPLAHPYSAYVVA
jgi:hypothetical protein